MEIDVEELIEVFTIAIHEAYEEMGLEKFKELDWFKYDNTYDVNDFVE